MDNEQNINYVRDMPDDFQFSSDSQDVQAIKDHLGELPDDYDSFFVLIGDGDYIAVYGMFGIVPSLSKHVYRVI